jgi:hypothetical protein
MPNSIIYNVSTQSLALKKGNFYIGTGDVGKGPSSSTGYFDGVSPSSGGYVIYVRNSAGRNLIYGAPNDSQLILITNRIAGASYTTVNECLVYFAGQTDKMVLNRNYESIVTDGLISNLDAGFTPSYPRSNTTWYDVGQTNNGTLINGPTFDSSDGGSIVFDGTNDYAQITTNISLFNFTTSATVFQWVRYQGARTPFLTRTSSTGFWSMSIRPNRGVNIETSTTPDDTPFTLSAAELPSGTWGLLTARWNNDGTMNGFWNGVNRGTLTQALSPSYANDGAVYFGWNGVSGNPIYGAGRVGVALIYNRALTNSEILQNYNAQKGRFGL